MKIHVYRVTHQFVVDVPDDRNEQIALQEALADVKAGKIEPEEKCDAMHVGLIPTAKHVAVPKNLMPGDVLRKLTRLTPEQAETACSAIGVREPGDPLQAHDRAQWLSLMMQRASVARKFPALWMACDKEGKRKTGS